MTGINFECVMGINFECVFGINFECVIEINFECEIGINFDISHNAMQPHFRAIFLQVRLQCSASLSLVKKYVLILDFGTDRAPSREEKSIMKQQGRVMSGFELSRNWGENRFIKELLNVFPADCKDGFEFVKNWWVYCHTKPF